MTWPSLKYTESVSQGSDFALVTLSTVSRYVVVAALDLTKQVRDARTGLRWTQNAIAARTPLRPTRVPCCKLAPFHGARVPE